MSLKISLAGLQFLLVLIAATTRNNEITLDASTSKFASKLYQEISRKNPANNLLISPVSIQLILGLVQTSAGGVTADELSEVLVLPENELILKEHLLKLRQIFQKTRVQGTSNEANVTIANAVYVRRDVRVSDGFYQTAKKYLDVDVRPLVNPLRDGSIVRDINAWIEQQTNGQLMRVLEEAAVTPDTVMLLVNTVYFKGKWRESGFNESETRPERFYSDGGAVDDVPMMRTSDYFQIGRYKTLNITYLELPYAGKNIDDTGDYVFAIYLPDTFENGLELIRQNIQHLLSNPPDITNIEQVDVRLPRFKIRAHNHLKPILEGLGLRHAFTNAQLPGLTVDKKSVQVTDVIHNTALDVTEEGAEASAVTVIGIDDRIFSQPLPFTANRPFMFALKQKSTNVALFVGHLRNAKL